MSVDLCFKKSLKFSFLKRSFFLCASIAGASKAGQLTSGVCELQIAVICNDRTKVKPIFAAYKSRFDCFYGLNFRVKITKPFTVKDLRKHFT